MLFFSFSRVCLVHVRFFFFSGVPHTFVWLCLSSRTKWKRQTAVGLELLAEAGNYAAVQRMLQSNPYWFTYHPQAAAILSNLDALYFRSHPDAASGGYPVQGQRPLLPRMFIHGLQQHVNQLPSPSSAASLYSGDSPRG